MKSEWPEIALEDCVEALIDYRGKTPEKTESGIPLITAKIIKSGRIETPTEFIAAENYDSWMRRGLPKEGDVVLTVEAPLGEVAQLGPEKIALAQRVVTLRGKKGLLDSSFLLYFLQTETAQELLKARATGTTVLGIKQSELRKIRIPVPPIDFQEGVAETLKLFDQQIDLLRSQNKTLEAIAQAIFKSWFIDFDPVKAKSQGRIPDGIDEATAALFPDSFQESALGAIPKGWAVRTIDDVSSVVKGKSYKSSELVDDHHTALVTLKSFRRGGGFRMDGFKPYTGSYKPDQVVAAGDLVVAYTDVTQAAELIARPAIVIGVDRFPTLVASLDVGVVRTRAGGPGKLFLYGRLNTSEFLAHALGRTSGTTVLHLAKDGVGAFSFACPPASISAAFEEIAAPLVEQIQCNLDEVQTLTELRDTLLPRLISGKLKLHELQEVAEAL